MLKLITSAADITPADVVVEVGPGLGILTRELARLAGWLVAVELDNQLVAILTETLAPLSNITIVNTDILAIDPADLIATLDDKLPARHQPLKYKVVANLPYYITSPVLRHFLEAPAKPEIMVVMVQKEVAEAITAPPGKMSVLSVSVQFYGEPTIVGYVPSLSFYPAPRVDSAILRVRLYPRPTVPVTNESSFFELVRAGFSAARKQIANSLVQGLGLAKEDVLSLLEEAGIAAQRRAETLTIEEWARLWQVGTRAGRLAS